MSKCKHKNNEDSFGDKNLISCYQGLFLPPVYESSATSPLGIPGAGHRVCSYNINGKRLELDCIDICQIPKRTINVSEDDFKLIEAYSKDYEAFDWHIQDKIRSILVSGITDDNYPYNDVIGLNVFTVNDRKIVISPVDEDDHRLYDELKESKLVLNEKDYEFVLTCSKNYEMLSYKGRQKIRAILKSGKN